MKLYFALGSMLAVCASASANLLTNGDFETDAYTAPYVVLTNTSNPALTGWTILGANVAGIKKPYLGAPNQEIDLSGVADTTPGTTGISQTVATTIGKKYFLSFDVFAGQSFTGYNGGVDLYIGGFAPGNLALSDQEGNRSTVNYVFTATSASTNLSFVSHEGNVSHIDNVVLSTPAPGAMVAFGLSAVGARVRRRRSAK